MPPTAQIVLSVATGALRSGLKQAAGMFAAFGRTVAGAPISVGRHLATELGKGILRHAGARGMDFLLDQGKQVFEFTDALTRFGIAARISGPALDDVGAEIRRVSSSTGINANEVLRGARAYVDLAGASAYTTEKMSMIAKASQASGSDINDMATVVYALQHSLDIPNTQLEDTIGGLINLSKDGAVHFNQMAQELVSLAPVYAQFGIKGRQGAIELASQLEVVRTGFGSASEAGTGLLRLYRSIPQHAKLFEGAGVQIFKKGSRTDLLTMGEILKNIKNSGLEKDRPALIKAFGRGEAERSYQLLDKLLNEYEELERLGHRNGVVQEDLATYTQSATGRMKVAYEGLKNAFADAMTPERVAQIVSGIEAIAQSAQGLASTLGTVGDLFGWIYNKGRQARSLWSGTSDVDANNPWHLTGDKSSRRDQTASIIAVPGQDPRMLAARDAAQASIANDAMYSTQARRLVGLSGGPDAPATEAGIRAALELKRGEFTDKDGTFKYGAGAEGAKLAGQRYLDNAPLELVKKINGEDLVRTMKPTLDALAKSITDAIQSGIKGGPPTAAAQALAIYNRNHANDIVVNVDANPVAKASSNATDRRRK